MLYQTACQCVSRAQPSDTEFVLVKQTALYNQEPKLYPPLGISRSDAQPAKLLVETANLQRRCLILNPRRRFEHRETHLLCFNLLQHQLTLVQHPPQLLDPSASSPAAGTATIVYANFAHPKRSKRHSRRTRSKSRGNCF